jgi:hypothetical protein
MEWIEARWINAVRQPCTPAIGRALGEISA